MPLAKTFIIAPGDVKSRAPLKKSTIVWIVAGVVVLALVGVFAPQMMGSSGSQNPAEIPKKEQPPGVVGDPRAIDIEVNEARLRSNTQRAITAENERRTQEEEAKKYGSQPPLPSTPGVAGRVVPPEASRTSNTAAVYAKASETPGLADPSSVEFDAAARTSASVKHDFGGASAVAKNASNDAAARLRAMMPEAPEPAGRAPAAGVDTSGNNLRALIEAQSRAAGGPVTGGAADQAWVKEIGSDSGRAKPIKPYPVGGPYTLLQGKVIPAVLVRDLNSDLPGEVTACTTVDIYDSVSSAYLLIPKGSCLMGRYQSAIRTGQERLMFAFTRIILPNAMSMDLPGSTGSDLSGAAGVAGNVNNHFFKMFASSFLVAFLADRAEAGKATPPPTAGSSSGATTAAGQVLVDVSRSILERQKNIQPTITIEKGTRINVEVTRDMEFPGPYRSR